MEYWGIGEKQKKLPFLKYQYFTDVPSISNRFQESTATFFTLNPVEFNGIKTGFLELLTNTEIFKETPFFP
jgi:hypothetical protein